MAECLPASILVHALFRFARAQMQTAMNREVEPEKAGENGAATDDKCERRYRQRKGFSKAAREPASGPLQSSPLLPLLPLLLLLVLLCLTTQT